MKRRGEREEAIKSLHSSSQDVLQPAEGGLQEKERAWTALDGRAHLFRKRRERERREGGHRSMAGPAGRLRGRQPRGILWHGVRYVLRGTAEVRFSGLLLCRFLLLLKTSAKVPIHDESSGKCMSTPQRDMTHPPD